MVIRGRLHELGEVRWVDGFPSGRATVRCPVLGGPAGAGVDHEVLVSGDDAAVLEQLWRRGDRPVLVVAGTVTSGLTEAGVPASLIEAHHVGVSLTDPSMPGAGSARPAPWT